MTDVMIMNNLLNDRRYDNDDKYNEADGADGCCNEQGLSIYRMRVMVILFWSLFLCLVTVGKMP